MSKITIENICELKTHKLSKYQTMNITVSIRKSTLGDLPYLFKIYIDDHVVCHIKDNNMENIEKQIDQALQMYTSEEKSKNQKYTSIRYAFDDISTNYLITFDQLNQLLELKDKHGFELRDYSGTPPLLKFNDNMDIDSTISLEIVKDKISLTIHKIPITVNSFELASI